MKTVLTVNLDGETFWSGMFEGTEKRPKTLSMGDYGIRRGLDRVLKTLKDYDMKATFFVPGLIAERHPETIEKVMKGGHEVAFKGYTHKQMHLLSREQIEEEFAKGTELFTRMTGQAPLGFRVPEGEFTQDVFEIAAKYGYQYSSSLYDRDQPYYHEVKAAEEQDAKTETEEQDAKTETEEQDAVSQTEEQDAENGKKVSRILEIPMNWNTHDLPYFAFNYGPAFPIGQSRVSSYERVTENYIEEFDAYKYYDLTFVPQFTPQSIGSPGKIQIMEKILAHIQESREEAHLCLCRDLL